MASLEGSALVVAGPIPRAGFPSQAWGVVSICRIVGIWPGRQVAFNDERNMKA
jgi:hypothetical protein